MGEKRRPALTILLRFSGKKKSNRVELFRAAGFSNYITSGYHRSLYNRYRIRLDGAWWPKGEIQFYTKTETKELIWKAIDI